MKDRLDRVSKSPSLALRHQREKVGGPRLPPGELRGVVRIDGNGADPFFAFKP